MADQPLQTEEKQFDERCELLKPFSTFPESNENQFSILSWNILIKTDTNHNESSSEYSKWEHRLSKIQETITSFGSDIVCLQECHSLSFIDDFAEFCATNGYQFKLNSKPSDSDSDPKYSEMATAILWKGNKFRYKYHDFRSKATILLLETMSSNDESKKEKKCKVAMEDTKPETSGTKSEKQKPPNAFQIYLSEKKEKLWRSLTVEEKQTYIERAQHLNKEWKLREKKKKEERRKTALDAMKSYVFITNVHLEAQGTIKEKKANKKEMRLNQMKHCIERITNYTKNKLRVQAVKNIQCVFCGDFNAERESEIDQMLTAKSHSNDNALIHELDLKNAYVHNIKKRIVSHWITNRLIDHFYYTFNHLKCVLCVDTVPDSMKSEDGMHVRKGIKYLNKDIVSDHLPIAAMFEIKRNAIPSYSGKKRTFAMMEKEGLTKKVYSANKKLKLSL